MATKQVRDGYWYRLEVPERLICCNCGLEHEIEFKLYAKWRLVDDEETGTERDKDKPRQEKDKEAKGLLSKGKKEDGKHAGKHVRSSKR